MTAALKVGLLGIGAIVGVTIGVVQLEAEPRLVGYGCGPEQVVMHFDEEDQFPDCAVIVPAR